ncbi:GerAB/ArcD/ProY family transporter [Paenibacillus glycinis]|uniref:GerAB/ArcD/ProY family transporter n=1 Tax=Paenibacillus glycinis TaxID=2697035 RepID=A0ABW9XN56_9BACL|nr:GerAB/ArcD/ProY family transporter [Paenibacillus glycinis]NBD24075.1 GerAB/ArcD/ProY family transporter [Paenibacillus glycinis]
MLKNLQVPIVFIITHMGLIFFLYPTDLIASSKETQWVPIFTGFLFQLAIMAVYLKGIRLFGNENIIHVLMKKSRWLAWATLLPVLLHLGIIAVLTVRIYAEIISIIFLSNTPLWILMCLLITIPTYIVMHGGVRGLMRTGLLLSLLFLISILFVLAYAFQNIDPRYALPLLPDDPKDFSFFVHPSYYKCLFAFSGCFLFLGFVPPYVAYKPKTVFIASLLLLPLFLMAVYIPILTLGEETARQLEFPFIFTIDTIEIDWLMFDRVTMFLVLSLLAFIMLFISLVFWLLTNIFRHSIKDLKPKILVPLVSVLTFGVCLFIPDLETTEEFLQWETILLGYVSIVTPLVVLFAGRHHFKQMKREIK